MKHNKLHLSKSTGHQVPEGYFDKVEEALWDQAKLSSQIDSHGFDVPDNYFDTFETKVLRKLKNKTSATKILPLWTWKTSLYASGIAASILLILGIFLNSNSDIDFNDLETVSIESYLSEEEFTDQDLAALTAEDYMLFDGFNETNIPDVTIENYLIEHSSLDDLEYISEP
ncbi:hypothetical protein [Mangrovimonas sp. TPBH4]|uniref:hypothetical protein n=1 Tax=Mangrovimonas sp. TPBH4 TaxID=1645914 RepID=UPI0006B571A1|nr:hypothetical protein [Mangrovimonas sp. TPBH4]